MKVIKLQKTELVALVDEEDFEYINKFKWNIMPNKRNIYAIRFEIVNGKNKVFTMHRDVLFQHTHIEKGKVVDHLDRNGLNNQKHNLKICTQSENILNSRISRTYGKKKKSSQYKGVSFDKNTNKWQAHISINGKLIGIGRFETEELANIARIKKINEF